MIDYLNDLREGCLEAYTGIIQGMKGEGSPAAPTAELLMIQPFVTHIVQVN
jgi:importin subunit beta-1